MKRAFLVWQIIRSNEKSVTVLVDWPNPGTIITIDKKQIKGIEHLENPKRSLILEVKRKWFAFGDNLILHVLPPVKVTREEIEQALERARKDL